MHVLMFYKTALVTECPITHNKSTRAVTIMNVLMCNQMAMLTELLKNTLPTYAATHHYVFVYVLSDCSYYCKPHYILHNYKGTHRYVCVDVLSEFSFH